METLNEDDLDWLTRVENRFATMRKRETEHHPQSYLIVEMGDAITDIRAIRVALQFRFNKTVDPYL